MDNILEGHDSTLPPIQQDFIFHMYRHDMKSVLGNLPSESSANEITNM